MNKNKPKNTLKENLLIRIFNYIFNKMGTYFYFKLGGPLQNHKAKIYNLHYIWRAPEIHIAKMIDEKVSMENTAIDIGAHFGYYTLLMAKKVGPFGKVISFEPSKDTRGILIGNIKKNRYQTVRVEKMGVSNGKKILLFNADRLSPMNSFVKKRSDNVRKIECTDLDSYCKENKIAPSFIKIDVEGVEKEVIGGMKQILKKNKPMVLLEATRETGGIHNIFKIFKKSGYKIYTWTKRVDEDSWTDLREITSPNEIVTKHIFFEKRVF